MSTKSTTQQISTDLVVLGSGPGGYTAAFRAADLGLKVTLIERFDTLGGVCLNVGCIPSKALLHTAKIIEETEHLAEQGVSFNKPKIDLKKVLAAKNKTVKRLTDGLAMMSKARKVQTVHGVGKFTSDKTIAVETKDGTVEVNFKHAIIAAGSQPVKLPFLPDDKRIMDSTDALELRDVPKNLLVLGGGIIGLEMATVYHALGSKVTIVEMMPNLMGGLDPEVVRPYQRKINGLYENVYLNAKVTKVEAKNDGLHVTIEGVKDLTKPLKFDKILSAVGRTPNGKLIGAENAGVKVDERGFIATDKQLRTNVPHIFAIGDIIGQPMLAHKAVHEGKIAAEVIAGKNHYFDPKVIPSVAYTIPEVAWVGLTEPEAKAQGINYGVGKFPWAASGRAICEGSDAGLTKVIFNKDNNTIIGAAIIGSNAGELISEAALAIEMGCDAEDIALTIHPHPTLSETTALAVEMFDGTITDLIPPKK